MHFALSLRDKQMPLAKKPLNASKKPLKENMRGGSLGLAADAPGAPSAVPAPLPAAPSEESFNFEECVIGPVRLMASSPKILLPGMLAWIPATVMMLIFANFLGKYSYLAVKLGNLMAKPDSGAIIGLLNEFIAALLRYLPDFIMLALLYIAISQILALVYSSITLQRRKGGGKEPALGQAFSDSFSSLISLTVANVLFILLCATLLIGGFFLVAAFAVLGPLGILFMVLLVLLGIGVLIFLALAGWVLSPIVLYEGASPTASLSKSLAFARANLKWGAVMLLVAGVISAALGQISSAFSSAPYLGLVLSNLFGLAVGAWEAMMPAEIYLELSKRK